MSDDLDGRAEAERRRLIVTGTLGVLADAHLTGLLDFETALAHLRNRNFYLTDEVIKARSPAARSRERQRMMAIPRIHETPRQIELPRPRKPLPEKSFNRENHSRKTILVLTLSLPWGSR